MVLVDAPARGFHDGDVADALAQLAMLWERTAERLYRRCQDLSDDEFFWEPVPGCWNIRPDPATAGRWTYEYDFDPPPPHPVTTIGWRLVHIAADNWIYWEHAFGPAARNFPDLDVPHTAAAALEDWSNSRRPISRWLRSATDEDLKEPRPSHLGAPKSAGEVLGVLLDEQIHHGAEIALLRDLYLHRGRS
jgi:uncharacterized damage-inducible protein DinB